MQEVSKSIKELAKEAFRKMGFEVRRASSQSEGPPRIFDNAFEALHYHNGGRRASFYCPLDMCVTFNGFNFSETGWHPFSAASQEYADGVSSTYKDSCLERFYDAWQPQNAFEALFGPDSCGPESLMSLPAFLRPVPWSSYTIEEHASYKWRIWKKENAEHGYPNVDQSFGHKFHGPVHPVKGRIEFERLTTVYKSIQRKGYLRKHGDVRGCLLKRGGDMRFMIIGGFHRAAVMHVLSDGFIPVTFSSGISAPLYDIDDVSHWPQVKSGLWTERWAEKYIDHIFDFDPLQWAVKNQVD